MQYDIQASIRKEQMTRFQVIVITICLIINTLDGFDVMAIAFAAPSLAKEWDLAPATLGLLFSSGLAGMMIGSLAIAPLADKFGRRSNILGCLITISIGMLASGLSDNAMQLAVMRFITGLGIGGMLASLNTMVAEYSSDKRRDLAVSILQIGVPLGATIGGVVSVYLVGTAGWRSIFLFGGIASTLMIFVVIPFIPESVDYLMTQRPNNALDRINRLLARLKRPAVDALPVQREQERSEQQVKLTSLVGPKLFKKTLAIWTAFFMSMFSFYFVVSWTPQLLVSQGLNVEQGISGGVLINIGGILGSLLLGYFSPRVGLSRLTACYMALSILFMALFGVMSAGLAVMIVIAFMLGFFIYGAMIGLYAIVPNIYPPHVRTTGTGWAIGVGRAGAIAGPYVAGLLIAADWSRSSYYMALSLPYIIGALVVLSFRLNRRTA